MLTMIQHAFRDAQGKPGSIRVVSDRVFGRVRLAASVVLLFLLPCNHVLAQSPTLRDLNSHSPFTPPDSLQAWEARAADLRTQLSVSLGLLPPLELDPIQPEIYGKLVRDGFSVEKVTFESLPGLYVTGNLYRPLEIEAGRQLPGILCPHGHWQEARFYDAGDAQVRELLASGAERFENAARNHIQARCVQLARMGCVVLHWDMIGYCDATQISFDRAHRFGAQEKASEVTDAGWLLYSPLAEAHCQSVMGLQALATRRAVDLLLSLPEIDPERIGITGASGGGTQSFIGAALDDRISLAFPAVMVSTGMQGGCTCENACWLRTGTGNIEIAGLCAPRPLGLTAADDWTKTMPQDGFPELRKLYGLYDVEDKVALFPAIHFGHNFNHVSRVHLYGWVNQHFDLGYETPILERDFELLRPEELTVWDQQHPPPQGGEHIERELMQAWAEIVDAQLTGLLQGDANQVAELMDVLRDGWRVSLGLTALPKDIEVRRLNDGTGEIVLSSEPQGAWSLSVEQPPSPKADNAGFGSNPYAVDIHEAIQEAWTSSPSDLRIQVITAEGNQKIFYPQLAGDRRVDNHLLKTSHQALVGNPRLAAAYTYGYNPPLMATRAQQLGLSLNWLRRQYPDQAIVVAAQDDEAALALAGVFCAQQLLAPGRLSQQQQSQQWLPQGYTLQLEPRSFLFADVDDIRDPSFLPGSVRYWGLPGLVACLRNCNIELETPGTESFGRLRSVYEIAGNNWVIRNGEPTR